MAKQRKKHEILGGIKVSSSQLSEWGSSGGRPQLYSSQAERARAFRLRRKQEKLGLTAELRGYRSYGEVQSQKTSITCPNCGKIETELRKYFDEKGEYIPETYWFDTVRMEKRKVRENQFHCLGCSHAFSFQNEKIKVTEITTLTPKSGSGKERGKRFREKGGNNKPEC